MQSIGTPPAIDLTKAMFNPPGNSDVAESGRGLAGSISSISARSFTQIETVASIKNQEKLTAAAGVSSQLTALMIATVHTSGATSSAAGTRVRESFESLGDRERKDYRPTFDERFRFFLGDLKQGLAPFKAKVLGGFDNLSKADQELCGDQCFYFYAAKLCAGLGKMQNEGIFSAAAARDSNYYKYRSLLSKIQDAFNGWEDQIRANHQAMDGVITSNFKHTHDIELIKRFFGKNEGIAIFEQLSKDVQESIKYAYLVAAYAYAVATHMGMGISASNAGKSRTQL